MSTRRQFLKQASMLAVTSLLWVSLQGTQCLTVLSFDWLHFKNNYVAIHCDVDSEKMEVVPHLLEW